ncbi:MAG: hypothetical protein Q8N63_03780 [Nanoarchaeota archaeon]|nr:hypothetical protein [Nanoarchaeota archaeon]
MFFERENEISNIKNEGREGMRSLLGSSAKLKIVYEIIKIDQKTIKIQNETIIN